MQTQDGAELCFPQLNTSCRKPTDRSKAVLLNLLVSLVSVLTVALNLLVIFSISHFRQLHTNTNTLLLSLAVSDFLVGLVAMPGETLRQTGCWFLGDLMCSIVKYLSSITVCASIGNMVLISGERYVAICDPLHYPTRVTVQRVRFIVCLCWLICVFYNGLYFKDEITEPGSSRNPPISSSSRSLSQTSS
ncbi:trace amine-associated receptor 13c-like [Mastacembelus armatus]|uniref:trace amine-associated receptor 13c-like n=1 Tax=Mastacembelus armatus TaxID=205130 RepID=UPI000E462250|nr:trace amine-associated receptor 13c-like [Mastacembelus armatus]